MEIEHRNEDYKNKSIYQAGNVFENHGIVYLICRTITSNGSTKYFLINLSSAAMVSRMYNSLPELELAVGDEDDTLVKAKVVVDYKLDGGIKGEDTK